jgi:hypothetical protein
VHIFCGTIYRIFGVLAFEIVPSKCQFSKSPSAGFVAPTHVSPPPATSDHIHIIGIVPGHPEPAMSSPTLELVVGERT